MIPDFLNVDADHVEEDFLVDSVDFVLDTISIIAEHLLLVGGFDSDDEELLENLNQHLFQGLVARFYVHYLKSINRFTI
jgi:hypothetical protein